MKRILNTFLNSTDTFEFGDYVLFQEYVYRSEYQIYVISKPILAIYLGLFVADQTVGFNYVRWNNDKRTIFITNKYVTNYRVVKQVENIEQHIEWDNFIDLLGHWKTKPTWKEILHSYRNQETSKSLPFDDVVV